MFVCDFQRSQTHTESRTLVELPDIEFPDAGRFWSPTTWGVKNMVPTRRLLAGIFSHENIAYRASMGLKSACQSPLLGFGPKNPSLIHAAGVRGLLKGSLSSYLMPHGSKCL